MAVLKFKFIRSIARVAWQKLRLSSTIPTSKKMSLSPLEESPPPYKVKRHWVTAHSTDPLNTQQSTLMEVEVFIEEKINKGCKYAGNYTIEGEDPNLKITHLPPSNRLH